jgi:hypothetical protein
MVLPFLNLDILLRLDVFEYNVFEQLPNVVEFDMNCHS